MKKIKIKKKKTWKRFYKKVFSFIKILSIQYLIFITYTLLFLLPIYLLQGVEIMDNYFISFVLLFPLIQSFFYMHYIQTGSLYSRFEVWMGMMIYFITVPFLIIFL